MVMLVTVFVVIVSVVAIDEGVGILPDMFVINFIVDVVSRF